MCKPVLAGVVPATGDGCCAIMYSSAGGGGGAESRNEMSSLLSPDAPCSAGCASNQSDRLPLYQIITAERTCGGTHVCPRHGSVKLSVGGFSGI